MTEARAVVVRALDAGLFPAAAVDVGDSAHAIWQDAIGTPPDTLFDLASLTKPIATGSVVMRLVANGLVSLDDRLADHFDEWRGDDRASVTVRDLLEHASGLSARLVDAAPSGRREFEHEICGMRLEYEPRTQSIYSDLGFILLGFLAADRGGSPLDVQFAEIVDRIAPRLTFTPPRELRAATAPTRATPNDVRRGETLRGVVHDNYAAALGGVAGHAGLFGTAADVAAFARVMLRAVRGDNGLPPPFTSALAGVFVARSRVAGSSRALAWDTMLPTSSCGARMSPSAFGHVGFTGTSLWIDPDRDRYFVLLTNRAYDGGSLEAMREVRRAFHDAAADL
ncbi:MAG TPA: serine hydrolase domain-containing protein [Vicinamibacterales bacterium]|nr:serine hydrolase domain-containing protein [Vicinamibacterales bacterium]